MHLKFAFLMKNGFNCMKLFDFVKQLAIGSESGEWQGGRVAGGSDVPQINSS